MRIPRKEIPKMKFITIMIREYSETSQVGVKAYFPWLNKRCCEIEMIDHFHSIFCQGTALKKDLFPQILEAAWFNSFPQDNVTLE